ncbi:MAG TPA: small multi-drug export protein [Candidatus Avoscillospira stercoripullorum]|uniref:Small multi-drug export protein n=1 Tax=Candidatus Avoscillospira stercoripullorum TaxID=2840709 RepID=A0A9D1D865_9FIRM|nr:small multi-drug export protein [Candidatus Avoscillospira stercoripullorum]
MLEILEEFWYVFFLAMVPVAELRGAIPAGIAMGLDPWLVYVVAVLGNVLPVPFLMLFVRQVLGWMKRRGGTLTRIVTALERKADRGAELFYRYELLGLCILVAVPLPGTGAWTGALVASMLRLRLKAALPAISLGVLIAGGIVLGISCGVSFVLM